ncbi:MAG: hypothetical protein P8166_01910 [Candidatus Thiodiazotropha sp.]|jgi:hypothetical protein
MKLGIVITDETLAEHAVGVIEASCERGWRNRCFLTDRGVLLLKDTDFCRLMREQELEVAVCELSMERYDHPAASDVELMRRVVIGGQYQDAQMVHNSDRVLVF